MSASVADIQQSELSTFEFWAQYAAAAYCHDSYASQTPHKITCWAGNCPQVEADGATIVFDFSNSTITDTSGYLATDDVRKAVVLAFRGSYSVRNWIADAEFPFADPGLCDGCLAELGFWTSWTNVRDSVMKHLKETMAANPDYELVVVGHSLGAAVATLAAADLRTKGYPSATFYAFASPRVANPALARFITDQGRNYRFTHTNDPVPKLPLLAMGYVHVSPEYWITAPDNDTSVAPNQVQVLEGEVNWNGNTGTGAPNPFDFSPHHWYFERTDGCIGPGLPLKI
ncbi:hypothetical protein ATEG_09976 [Aspergillus terreus NIH2624]|uniref:feruloyl esterase n=1 Tax=Aspergillus terreus (strain NIH 2624 / FGSC A1156) TaxID=341663 RepID=Q0C8K8_ASPTN|nr:uncharacterized protein ATEG_09976 [Aspergillus terreus NIH2624]EAU29425.1 hypothetical protein ATEG_09976 [Aspergillus terreus NIH2624]